MTWLITKPVVCIQITLNKGILKDAASTMTWPDVNLFAHRLQSIYCCKANTASKQDFSLELEYKFVLYSRKICSGSQRQTTV